MTAFRVHPAVASLLAAPLSLGTPDRWLCLPAEILLFLRTDPLFLTVSSVAVRQAGVPSLRMVCLSQNGTYYILVKVQHTLLAKVYHKIWFCQGPGIITDYRVIGAPGCHSSYLRTLGPLTLRPRIYPGLPPSAFTDGLIALMSFRIIKNLVFLN